MPTKGNIEVNTFVKGLITESSPLTFPENASLDEINMELLKDGSRQRRLGIDLEEDGQIHDSGLLAATLALSRQSFFRWHTPNGSTKVDIGIIQIGFRLYFINLLKANPSAHLLNGGLPLEFGLSQNAVFEYALMQGSVIVVSASLDTPFLLSYDDVADVVSFETDRLLIRDLSGVDDGLAVDTRPTELSNAHEYNLRNQGWSSSIITTCISGSAIECTKEILGIYPGNSDQWSLGKIADVTSADVDKFDPKTAEKNTVSIGAVARGSFIIDLYNRGATRSFNSGISLITDRELSRASTVASFAGRAWYSGIRSEVVGGDKKSLKLAGAVLFSQIADEKTKLIKCYQESDPTSPEVSDVVDSDGGIIDIPGASQIIKILPIKASLFVFARNGIWEIRGDESGFRATSFQVNKVSSVEVFSPQSIVEVNGTIFFWSTSGIYVVTPNQFETGYDTVSITLATIQSLYNSFPDLVKQNAKGFFDLNSNTVRWLFNSTREKRPGFPFELPQPKVLEIGDPVTVNFPFPGLSADCRTISSTEYAIIAILETTTPNHLYGVIAGIPSKLSTKVVVNPPIALETTKSWFHVSVEAMTSTKLLVTLIEEVTNNIYGMVLTVSGTSIVPGPLTLLTATHGFGLKTKLMRINETEVILVYIDSTAFDTNAAILTVSGTSVVLSSDTTVIDNGVLIQQNLDIAPSGKPDEFIITGSTPGEKNNVKIKVLGTAITSIIISDDLQLYTGTVDQDLTWIGDNEYITIAQNVLTGINLVVYDSENGTSGNMNSAGSGVRVNFDIAGTTKKRSVLITADKPEENQLLRLEIFKLTKQETTTTSVDTVIDGGLCLSINISNVGFTATKFPVVYHHQPSQTIRTFVYEAGE